MFGCLSGTSWPGDDLEVEIVGVAQVGDVIDVSRRHRFTSAGRKENQERVDHVGSLTPRQQVADGGPSWNGWLFLPVRHQLVEAIESLGFSKPQPNSGRISRPRRRPVSSSPWRMEQRYNTWMY